MPAFLLAFQGFESFFVFFRDSKRLVHLRNRLFLESLIVHVLKEAVNEIAMLDGNGSEKPGFCHHDHVFFVIAKERGYLLDVRTVAVF